MNFITNSAVIVKPRSLSCLKAILETIMPCLPILWPLVPDGWLVWELWLTLKWEGKLILKSSTENEAGTVTDCACTPCCLQWSLCNRWMLRMVPSAFCKLSEVLYCCSFLEKLWVLVPWLWSHIYLQKLLFTTQWKLCQCERDAREHFGLFSAAWP